MKLYTVSLFRRGGGGASFQGSVHITFITKLLVCLPNQCVSISNPSLAMSSQPSGVQLVLNPIQARLPGIRNEHSLLQTIPKKLRERTQAFDHFTDVQKCQGRETDGFCGEALEDLL